MKSFTDINQSKKLAEILPLESADMCYPLPCDETNKPLFNNGGFGSTPCWSLDALLEVLPQCVDDGRYALVLGEYPNKDWHVSYTDIYHFAKHYVTNSNLIDACYEMILKLHEQKLI